MKRIILFLLLIPFFNYGQTSTQILNGFYNASTNYGFSCNVQVQITKSIIGNKIIFKSKLLSVKMADTKGWYDNSMHKYYSCDLVGNYCVIFPQFLDVKTEYGDLPFDSYSFAYVGEERVIYESTVAIFKSVTGGNVATFKIPAISQVIITHKQDAPIWDKLSRIRQSGSSTSGAYSGNSNPLSSTSSSTNTNPLPSKTVATKSNIDPNTGLMTNPLSYSAPASNNKFVKDVQLTTQAVSAAIDLFTPNAEQQERRRIQQEKLEQQKLQEEEEENKKIWARIKNKEKRYLEYYQPKYYEKAKAGDNYSKMVLYYASDKLICKNLLPERETFFKEALANKSLSALLEDCYDRSLWGHMEDIKNLNQMIDLATNKNNVDAMVCLANYYDRNKGGLDGKGLLPGGENNETALHWYEKAAELGSPNANLALAKIYSYQYSQGANYDGVNKYLKKIYVKYNVEKNEKKALEYLLKAENPNYKSSLFAFANHDGSYFKQNVYNMLSVFYRKGLGGLNRNWKLSQEYYLKAIDYKYPEW